MHFQRFLGWTILLAFGIGAFLRPDTARAAPPQQVSAYELIIAMNTLRVSNGLPALIEDPIVNAVAQSTAQIMAANNMSWHMGDVRGRIAAAGYGAGGTVWATENFAVGNMGIDEIMAVWADPDHMRPAVNPAYCHVGAGVAQTSSGRYYYILQAAYVSGQECGSSSPSASGGTSQPGVVSNPVSQLIVPVQVSTPDEKGEVYHEVRSGQSLWAIAIAYQITINDLESWNNLTRETPLQSGQRLFIPGKTTVGYATPTPKGMIVPQAPDANGRIVHEVQPYQALITIAEAYQVSVDQLLGLNNLTRETPLQIGQQILVSPGNITPSPTLSPIQRLTPEADGSYYHTVQSGETLSWIAGLYEVPLADLMAWNGLNNASVIRPGQKLLLLVAPPATATPTETLTQTPLPPTPSPPIVSPSPTGTPSEEEAEPTRGSGLILIVVVAAILAGVFIWWKYFRKT